MILVDILAFLKNLLCFRKGSSEEMLEREEGTQDYSISVEDSLVAEFSLFSRELLFSFVGEASLFLGIV